MTRVAAAGSGKAAVSDEIPLGKKLCEVGGLCGFEVGTWLRALGS